MVKFRVLEAKNKQYNSYKLTKLHLLYKGGYDILENSAMFLTKLASETDVSFEDRLKSCSYLPYMSDVIDHYVSMLFEQELTVKEASDADDNTTIGEPLPDDSPYKLFMMAADGKGNSLEQSMRNLLTDAMIYNYSVIGVDFPKAEDIPINLLEEEVMQTGRPYLYYVDPQCLIDWQCDDNGNYTWTKIREDKAIQNDPLAEPKHLIEWKIWTLKGGTAKWEIYRTAEMAVGKTPNPNDDIPLAESGTTSFKEIPLLKLCLPDGLSMGNKIGPICQDIFQRTSMLVNGENKSLNAMRVVFLGDEDSAPGGATPSMVQENPFRHLSLMTDWESKGIAVLGANDKMDIVESQGHAFKIVAEQIDKLVEKLKEVVHQMANSVSRNAKSAGRSAASKQEDRRSTEILLSAYGVVIRDFTKHLMSCISSARDESIVWVIDGLDNFSIIDRDQLILEAAKFPQITSQSVSPTFTKLYTQKFYLSLLDGASNEDAETIKQEIQDGIEAGKVPGLGAVGPDGKPLDPPMQGSKPSANASPAADSPDGADSMFLGPAGQPLMPEGGHLQTGEHISGQTVFDQLSQDYEDKDIEWVKHVPWIGPVEVPLSSIDFSNKDNWQASEDQDHVDMFQEKIQDGFSKPIILVNNPSNDNKMSIVDGHHRALAYQQSNQPAVAYIGQVGSDKGPWSSLHDQQVGKKGQGPGQMSMQKSNQTNETSLQKQVSKQVSKSAKAKGGKTK